VAHCHAQTLPSIGAHVVCRFVGNRLENVFSDGIHVILVASQELSASDEFGINPVIFYGRTGGFVDAFAPRTSTAQEQKHKIV